MNSTIGNSILAQRIGTYGYIVTFTLGLIGHSCSLLTFSQHELRATSTTLLFLTITLSDLSYQLMSLYDFILITLGLPQLSPYYIPLCRFRTFILNFTQTTSAWLLVLITFDRFVRAYLPHRTRQWCTHRNAIIVVCITILCSVGLNSHVLQPLFTVVFPFTRVICGPSRLDVTDYATFYYFTWPVLQICINILTPALLMMISLIMIYRKVRQVGVVRRNRRLQNQMLLLMLSKTLLFLTCTLVYGAYRMATVSSMDTSDTVKYQLFLVVTAALTVLLNANYSISFYVHCLTSTLFRQIFLKTIKKCWQRRRRPRGNTVQPTAFIATQQQ